MRHLNHIRPLILCAPLLALPSAGCQGDDVGTSATDGATDSDATGGSAQTEGTTGSDSGSDDGTGSGTATSTTSDDTTTTGTTDDTTTGQITEDTGEGECGDLMVDPGEECDDGNLDPGDGCEADCTLTPAPDNCGNGELDDDEACDGDLLPVTECSDIDEKFTGGALSCAENCSFNTSACEVCQAPGQVIPCDAESDDVLHALGLACDTLGDEYADANKHIPIEKFSFNSPDTDAYRVAKQFGSHLVDDVPIWGPKEGEKFLLISTGNLPPATPDGVVLAKPGSAQTGVTQNDNQDGLTSLPGVMSHKVGSNNGGGGTPFVGCDGTNDCSDTLSAQWNLGTKTANDVLYFQFDVKVPKGTYGYNVDFAYFSAEYPEWVNTSFNDMAALWSTSESYTGNVTFISDNNNSARPLTVTALAQNGLIKFMPDAPELADTGFDGEGGGTGWATVKGSATPEETFTLAWTVFDKGDSILDTALLIDNWRWDCAGCVPNEVTSCGIAPQ